MIEIEGTNGTPVLAWVDAGDDRVLLEDSALEQIKAVAALPFVERMAVMPDVHAGRGSTIGTVMETRDAVIPAAVGVDIGCGVLAWQTGVYGKKALGDLGELRREIERLVPHGRTNNGGHGDRGAWHDVPDLVRKHWDAAVSEGSMHGFYLASLAQTLAAVCDAAPELRKANALNHLGTLGTGNHFVELDVDQNDMVWILVHSGSRGIGASIGNLYARRAKELRAAAGDELPSADLAWIAADEDEYLNYFNAHDFAVAFAKVSRGLIACRVLEALDRATKAIGSDVVAVNRTIDCRHNYVMETESGTLVTRKGAVRASKHECVVIPGSMGTKSYIGLGRGEEKALESCSHGAGRAMSRTEARKRISAADHATATTGVECRKDEGLVDESPGAYKDIDLVMDCQRDLVSIVHRLTPFLCVKG